MFRLWVLLALAGTCRPDSPAPAPHESPGHAAYRRADALLRRHELNASSAAVQEALALDPKLVPALLLKSRLALIAGRGEQARILIQRAISLEPGNWYAHFLYAFQFYVQNRLAEALPEFEKASRLDPQEPMPRLYLAMTHDSLGHAGDALLGYQEAIRLEKAREAVQATTLLALARFLMATGRSEEAAPLVDRALALDPKSRNAHYLRARLLIEAGDAPAAARECEAALTLESIDVTDKEIRYVLARAYRLAGRPEDAARQVQALRNERTSQPR